MSPPKVNLAVKETPAVSDEPLPGKDDFESPAVVIMETAPEVRPRSVHQRARARRIMCGIALIVVFTVAAVGTMALVHRLRRHHRKQWTCGTSNSMPEHVKVDHENKLIRVHHDHDRNHNTPAMQILHEYNRQMVAYKDMDKKICYIDRLDETFTQGYERWESYEKHDRKDRRTLKVISKPIEVDVMRHVLDIHITAHCTDASNSFWVMEIEEKKVTTEMVVIRV